VLILDTVGDYIQAEASVDAVITITCYGIEEVAGATTYKKLAQSLISNTGTTLYTVPGSTSTVCTVMVIANTNVADINLSVWHVPFGGAEGDDNVLFKSIPIIGRTTVVWNKGEISQLPTDTGAVSPTISYVDSFVTGDWVLNVNEYDLDFSHGLSSLYPVVEVRNSSQNIVYTHEVFTIDLNTTRLIVPVIPDLRFDGTISIIKA
jgi:hypothetical protein